MIIVRTHQYHTLLISSGLYCRLEHEYAYHHQYSHNKQKWLIHWSILISLGLVGEVKNFTGPTTRTRAPNVIYSTSESVSYHNQNKAETLFFLTHDTIGRYKIKDRSFGWLSIKHGAESWVDCPWTPYVKEPDPSPMHPEESFSWISSSLVELQPLCQELLWELGRP